MIPFVVGAALVQALAAQPPQAPVPFGVGESYEYRGHKGLAGTVGSATLSVVGIESEQGVASWHFKLTTTANALLGLYKSDSKLESWTSVHDFVSRRFVHFIRENGKIEADDDFHIHADSGYYRNHSDTLTKKTPPLALDDLAFIYYLRTVDFAAFKKDSVYKVSRYFREEHNPVEITVLGHDSIEMPDGTRCYCWLVHPVVDEPHGLFSRTADARLWLTDDGLRIPVQIGSKVPFVGYVWLTLSKITRRN
jgi:hypothetical protein